MRGEEGRGERERAAAGGVEWMRLVRSCGGVRRECSRFCGRVERALERGQDTVCGEEFGEDEVWVCGDHWMVRPSGVWLSCDDRGAVSSVTGCCKRLYRK